MDLPETDDLSSSARTRLQVSEMRARDARGRRTMAALHVALLDLVEDQPFEDITVDDIVGRAGVGRSTFYRHYEGKDALIEEIGRNEITHFFDLALPFADRTNSLPNCRRVADYVGNNRALWSALLTGGAGHVMRQKFMEIAVTRAAQARNVPEHGIPRDLATQWGITATLEVLIWWLRHPDRANVDQVADYLDRLTVRPALEP